MLNITSIPSSRVPLIDSSSGLITREWFLFLQNLFYLTGSGGNDITLVDVQVQSALNATDPIVVQQESLFNSTGETLSSLQAAIETLLVVPPATGGVLALSTTSPITTTGGTAPSIGIVNQGTTTTLLHGNVAGNATFSAVVENDMSLSNVTTNDATTARHGFLPILPNSSTTFLNGQGNFAVPPGTGDPKPQALTITAAATYTVLITDCIVKVTTALNTTTLLSAVTAARYIYYINNASSGSITVNTTSSQTINGVLTQVVPLNSTLTVYSDGSNWNII